MVESGVTSFRRGTGGLSGCRRRRVPSRWRARVVRWVGSRGKDVTGSRPDVEVFLHFLSNFRYTFRQSTES